MYRLWQRRRGGVRVRQWKREKKERVRARRFARFRETDRCRMLYAVMSVSACLSSTACRSLLPGPLQRRATSYSVMRGAPRCHTDTTTPTITALCGRRTALQLGLRRRRRRRLVTQEREDRRVHVHRWKDRRSRAAPTHVATRCHSQFTRFSETRFSQNHRSPSLCDTSPLMGLQCRPAHVSTRLQAARACIHSHLPRLNRLSFFAPLSERC